MFPKRFQWTFLMAMPVVLLVYFTISIEQSETMAFMPGESSHGHYQIEMECSVCHTDDYAGVKQDACLKCHEEELARANDSHPASKFEDPRNAERLEQLDARYCITCHREHQPEETGNMGLTLPDDYCFYCHQDIAEDRPSHEGMGYETCATAGCHNYHDNSALYEDFLIKHSGEVTHKIETTILDTDYYEGWAEKNNRSPLEASDRDAPQSAAYSQGLVFDWHDTAHAAAGVNCMDCHRSPTDPNEWVQNPGASSCSSCHEYESETFLQGRHGMRLAHGLSPMTPGMARIPMKESAAHQDLSCLSCHSDHRFDRSYAAVNACLGCHDDTHSLNYKNSPHFDKWQEEGAQGGSGAKGASCASCHMPRIEVKEFGVTNIRVQHNQNDNLRPNEKMIRTACMNCHGLEFSIDSLADPDLIENNFSSLPKGHIESMDMVMERLKELGRER